MAVPANPDQWYSTAKISGCDYGAAPVAPSTGSTLYGRDLSLVYTRCLVLGEGDTIANPQVGSYPSAYRRFSSSQSLKADRMQYLSDHLTWLGNNVAGTSLTGGAESGSAFTLLGAFSTLDEAVADSDDYWDSYYAAIANANAVVKGLLVPAGSWNAPTFAVGTPVAAAPVAAMFSRCSQLKWIRRGGLSIPSDSYFYVAAWANSPPYDYDSGTFVGDPTYEYEVSGPDLRSPFQGSQQGTSYMDAATAELYADPASPGWPAFAQFNTYDLTSYCPTACPDASTFVLATVIGVEREWTEYTSADHSDSHRVQTYVPVVTAPMRVTRAAGVPRSSSDFRYVFSPAQRVALVKALATIAGGPPVISGTGEPSQYYASSWVWTSGITWMNFSIGAFGGDSYMYVHPEYCEP